MALREWGCAWQLLGPLTGGRQKASPSKEMNWGREGMGNEEGGLGMGQKGAEVGELGGTHS